MTHPAAGLMARSPEAARPALGLKRLATSTAAAPREPAHDADFFSWAPDERAASAHEQRSESARQPLRCEPAASLGPWTARAATFSGGAFDVDAPPTPRSDCSLRELSATTLLPDRAVLEGGSHALRSISASGLETFRLSLSEGAPEAPPDTAPAWDWEGAGSASERDVQRTSSLRPRDFVPNDFFGNSPDRGGVAALSGDMSTSDQDLGTEFDTAGSRESSLDLGSAAAGADADAALAAWEAPAAPRKEAPRSEVSADREGVPFDAKAQRLVRQVGMLQALKDAILRDVAQLDRRRINALHAANQAEEVLRRACDGAVLSHHPPPHLRASADAALQACRRTRRAPATGRRRRRRTTSRWPCASAAPTPPRTCSSPPCPRPGSRASRTARQTALRPSCLPTPSHPPGPPRCASRLLCCGVPRGRARLTSNLVDSF